MRGLVAEGIALANPVERLERSGFMRLSKDERLTALACVAVNCLHFTKSTTYSSPCYSGPLLRP